MAPVTDVGRKDSSKSQEEMTRARRKCRMNAENLLLASTIFGVAMGILIGVLIKVYSKPLSPRELQYLSFPGSLFLQMLKLLILPLITSSLITSLTSLDTRTASKIGLYATGYYFCTTILAVITGIILVVSIKPGTYGHTSVSSVKDLTKCKGTVPADTILDLLRNMFPDNVVAAAFQSKGTCVRKARRINGTKEKIPWAAWEKLDNETQDTYLDEPYRITKSGMNVLGVVVFALVLGVIINDMGPSGEPLAHFFAALDGVMKRLVSLVIWISPIGIMFLIAGKIAEMEDLEAEVKRLGMYMVTVLCGLFIHGCITLPVLFFVLARKNPFKYVYGMAQALLTALGTASSSATMPLTLKNLEENNNVDERVTRFMIPLGATINMDGTALYEAVAALYIAQTLGVSMGIGEVILISLCATLASIGAAGIPEAGLVTMIMVLIAVGLPESMFSLIVPVDWFLDRIRTTVNVHGDALGAGIVERLCQDQLEKDHHKLPDESARCRSQMNGRTGSLQIQHRTQL